MEKEVVINTTDDHKIYGLLNSPERKTDKLVIFVHGFTGNSNEHIFFNGAKHLKENNIASFRFDLYTWREKGRSFTDCDIQIHVDDLKTVFDHFKSEFAQIYIVGHSLGGVVVLESKLDPTGIILWDCSDVSDFLEDGDYEYNKSLDAYLLNWGLVFVVGKKMYEDTMHMKSATELISNIHSPIKIICSGEGILIKGGKEYFDLAKEPKSFAIIKNAGHTFDEEGTEEELFKETVDWVKKF
jgi:esterase/lipase